MWQQLRIQQPEYQVWLPHSNLTPVRGGSLGLAGVVAANKNIFTPISALISHQSWDLPFVNEITIIMYICKMEQRKLVLMIKEHIYSWDIDITHCKTLLICFKWTLTTHTYLESCVDQNQFCHKTAENRISRRTQPPTPTGMCLCFGRFCTVGGLKNIWGEAKYPQKSRYHKNTFQNIDNTILNRHKISQKSTILNRHRISQKVQY